MNNETYSPINTQSWNNLIELASEIKTSASPTTIKQLFADDSERVEKYSLKAGELKLDFSKNLIDDPIFEQLLNLVNQSPFLSHRDAMFSGEAINTSENRSVLHAALRAAPSDDASKDAVKRAKQVEMQLKAVERISNEIRKAYGLEALENLSLTLLISALAVLTWALKWPALHLKNFPSHPSMFTLFPMLMVRKS